MVEKSVGTAKTEKTTAMNSVFSGFRNVNLSAMQKKKKDKKPKASAAKTPKKKKAPRKSSLSVDTNKATNVVVVNSKTKKNNKSKTNQATNPRNPLDTLAFYRVGLAVVLIVSAAAFGYGSYVWIDWSESQTLHALEQELARTQFAASAERAHTAARAALERSKRAAESLAAVAGSTFPTPTEWPLVRIPGFEAMADPLRKVAMGSLGFAPVVLGVDKERFENYWYDYYYNIGYLNSEGDTFINKLGDTTSNFGNGIFGIGGYDVLNDKAWRDTRYPILVNGTKHGVSNPDNLMVPLVQSEDGLDSHWLMLDKEADYHGFLASRAALECAQDLRENPDDDWAAQNSLGCGSLSDLVWDATNPRDVSVGPSGTLFLPIYPGNDVSREVAGFIVHDHLWRNLFRGAFHGASGGIRIVLKTDSSNGHTFEVLDGGRVVYVGNQTHTCSGNFTDKECLPDSAWEPFDDLYYLHEDPSGDFRSLNLGITDGIVSQDASSVRYFVDVYATPEFVDRFCATDANIHQVTNDLLPIPLSVAVCLGVINIMLFTSLMFVLYDYFVQKSQGRQAAKGTQPVAAGGLLAAKRKFVRFVSHEIRTPLNTVCMGLTLLENDLAAALGERDDDKRIYPSKGRGSSGKGGTLEKALSVIKSPPEPPPGENPSPRSNYKDPYSVPLFQQNFLPSFTESKKGDESVRRRVVGDDELVLKKKSVEDWLSLSGQVVRNADNAVGVLSDLLIYDKVQTGNLSLEVSLMDLWGTLENVVEGFSAAAAEKSVSLSIDFAPLVESPASPKEPPKVEKSTKPEKDSKPSSIRFWKKSTESGKDDKDKDEKPSSLKALWKKTTESPKDEKPSSTKGHWKVYENPVELERASAGKGRKKRESLTLDKAFSGSTTNLKASDLPERIQNCKIIGDKIRLTQVFRNLISYGLKFSKKRSNIIVRVSMRIFPERSQKLKSVKLSGNASAKAMNVGTVTVEIIQEGIGMKQTEIDAVFEDSTQFVENIEQSNGSNQNHVEAGSNEGIDLNENKIGLGMNIARCIVVQHGGSLTCSSRGARKGTTFALTVNLYTENNSIVPLACAKTVSEMSSRSVMSDDDMPDDVERGMGSRDSLPSFHVLVVDDTLTNRKLCQRLLERSGHTTEGASNGKEAVEMVKESLKNGKFYDTILLDYEMPVMNGPDACRLIRQLGCLSYIAGVTGNVMSEDVDRFRRCGANWVLSKPFSIKAIEDQWIEDNVKHVVQTGGDVMGSGEEQEVILGEK